MSSARLMRGLAAWGFATARPLEYAVGVREHPYRYALRETGRVERRECPSCRSVEPMTIMETVQSPTLEVALETLYRCPRCQRLAIRPGVVKRVGGLLLLVPFLGLIGGALVAAAWMAWSMASSGDFDPGFALVALLLVAGSIGAARPALRTLRRLARPDALLPLSRHASGEHQLSGEL